ncbi:MAG TPA: VOC family protein [Thermomicrobiales bacterium]|nr:VOC family protein [Thermomicrobiales bacterium]
MTDRLSCINGIHHLTAVSRDAQRTVDFYTGFLGLRLIERPGSVDDPSSCHLSFATEENGPGVLTFFERKDAPRGSYGIGGTHHLAFETQDRDTLLQWKRWLTDSGIHVTGPYNRVYFESIYFTDPDGLILEIATRGPGWTVDEAPDALGSETKLPPPETTARYRDEATIAAETWPDSIPETTPEMRLRRMHHITAIGSDAGQTERFFVGILGMRLVKRTVNFDDPSSPHLYFGVDDGAPGTIVTYFAYPHGTMRPVRMGAGLTHHFALSVADEDALGEWRDYLNASGVPTTEIKDRAYFRSIYFHDPDGHIVEIATDTPGFTVDETQAELGRSLQLPQWLQPRRNEIERSLTPITVRDPIGR